MTSDVGVDTTLKIIERIEARVARDKYVGTDELTAMLRDEIALLLTENNTDDLSEFSPSKEKALCDHGGRGEWCRKNDDHR